MGASTLLGLPGQPGPMQPGDYTPASAPSVVSFGFTNIGPPSPLYVQRDDVLVLEIVSPIATDSALITARLLLPSPPQPGQPSPAGQAAAPPPTLGGPAYIEVIQQVVKVNFANTLNVQTIPLAEGYLLSVTVSTSAGSSRGQTYVRVWIARGPVAALTPNTAIMLLADYVTAFHSIGWPAGRVVFSTEGPGLLKLQTVTSPAAGTDWSFSIPSNQRWRISSFNAQLATNATAGNRTVRVQIKNGGANIVWQAGPSQNIPASTTAQVSGSPGQVTSTVDATTVNLALPGAPFLLGADTIGVSTLGLLGTDAWTAISIEAETWVDNV